MSPKTDNQEPEAKPDVTVDIPHDEKQTPPAPATAPPLPELEPLPIRPINITDNVSTPPPVVPVVPLVSPDEFHEHEGRRWPVILMYIVLAFLVALLVVFAGRWIYRKTAHQSSKVNKPVSTNQGQAPAAPPTTTQNPPTGSNNSNSNSSASNSTFGAGKNQTVQTTPAGQLPNNGPGDVIALFVGTTLAIAGLHFIYNLRKQN